MRKLLFVYNANSGLGNSILDSVHKIFSPKTYNCNLCDITYGVFKENTVWKSFRAQASLDLEFLHKNDFLSNYPKNECLSFTFPVVLEVSAGDLKVFVSTTELNKITNVEDLINVVQEKVEA